MRKRSITKVGAVLLALATVLAGCGSADSAKENGASNETVAEVTSEENSETETAEKEVNDNDTLTATAADATYWLFHGPWRVSRAGRQSLYCRRARQLSSC